MSMAYIPLPPTELVSRSMSTAADTTPAAATADGSGHNYIKAITIMAITI